MREYESKAVIRKRDNDCYELCWNVNNMILAVMNKNDMHLMIECLQVMMQNEPSYLKDYHFPTMIHKITG